MYPYTEGPQELANRILARLDGKSRTKPRATAGGGPTLWAAVQALGEAQTLLKDPAHHTRAGIAKRLEIVESYLAEQIANGA
jgi:hypothetical protein